MKASLGVELLLYFHHDSRPYRLNYFAKLSAFAIIHSIA